MTSIETHIINLLDPDTKVHIKGIAIKALCSDHTARALEALLKASHDQNYSVRLRAVHALGNQSIWEVNDHLLSIMSNDSHATVRAHAIEALAKQGAPGAIPKIAEKHFGEKISVQQASANALYYYSGSKSLSNLARGVYFYNLNKFTEALDCFNNTLVLDTNNFYAYYYRGMCFIHIDENEKALEDLTTYLDLQPEDPIGDGFYNRGILHSSLHDDKETMIKDLLEQIKWNPDHANAQWDLGNYYLAIAEIELAIEHFSKYIKQKPDDIYGYKYRAACYKRNNQIFLGIEDHTRIIELDPSWSNYGDRASYYMEAGLFNDAIEDCDQAIRIDPTYFSYLMRGESLAKFGDYKAAIKDCNKSIELRSSNPSAYILRAECYYHLNNKVQAHIDFKTAIEIVPRLGYYGRSKFYRSIDEREKSLSDLDEVIKITPQISGLHLKKACDYAFLGKEEKAIDSINMAFKLLKGDTNYVIKEIENESDLDAIRGKEEYIKLVKSYQN